MSTVSPERLNGMQDPMGADIGLLESAFDQTSIGMGLIRINPDGSERLVRVNRALCEIVGRSEAELVGNGLQLRELSPSSRWSEALRRTGNEGERFEFEHTLERPDRTPIWALVTLSPLDSHGEGLVRFRLLQVQDISERRQYETRLQFLAEHDSLTGLANLKRFDTIVNDWLAYQRRYGGEAALMSFDLDRFKLVNDAAGHAAGDETLKEFAHFLVGMVRETDTVARLGGDEFAVFLPGVGAREAMALAEEILARMRTNPIRIHPEGIGSVALSTSAGVTELGGRDVEARDLLVEADTALYAAKRAGRNCVINFSFGADPRVADKTRLTWAERTRRALKEGNFFLEAQPIVNLESGEVIEHEALLRMNDPDEGVVYPPTFLYTAERFGLSAEIDEWVVETVITHLAEAPDQTRRVSLNLSSASLDISSDLPDRIPAMLREAEVDPHRIDFELTEGTCIIDIERARGFVRRMRESGIRVVLDDFGAGFASFHYLKFLPVDVIKLDAEFIRSLPTSSDDRIIVEAVTEMAHGLSMEVVAEFVADQEIAGICRRLGVDHIQGAAAGPTVSLGEALAESR